MSKASWVVVVCVVCALVSPRARAQEVIVEAASSEQPPTVQASPPSEAAAQLEFELAIEEAPSDEESAVAARPAPVARPAAPRPAARPEPRREDLPPRPQAILLHGFRLGYLHIMNTDTPLYGGTPSQIYAERYDMRSPHMFMIGYELAWRMVGYDWLNLLLIGNVMFAGLEQSRFFPSANLMLGFEFAQMAQVGLGVSVTPTKEEPAHLVVAAGWTPQIGSFFVPIHAFFVPDIEGHHKLGITVGITFF